MDKSLEKFFILFGTFWLFVSISVGFPLIAESAYSEEGILSILFMIPFYAIGIGCLAIGLKGGIKRKKFLKKGISYYGKIVSYESNPNIHINGNALQYIEVRYFDRYGRINNACVSTGSDSKRGFNLGETVQICEYNGEVILISERSQNIKIQGEETLIMTYNTGAQSITQIRPESYTCPHCGANLMIIRGQTVKCPYCDSFVTNNRQFA